MNFPKFILLNILLLIFASTLNSQSIFSSINQNGSNVEIKLVQPLYLFNITNLDNLYNDYDLNGTSVLNSCIFNTTYFSLDLSILKNIDYIFKDSNSKYQHLFSICSRTKLYSAQSVMLNENGQSFTTGNLNTEKFEIGRFGLNNYSLKLTYTNPAFSLCSNSGSTRNYYFQCDENLEFNITSPNSKNVNYYDCNVDVTIATKYVCPYKNIKKSSIKYSLIQPNILRFTLDENSSNLISINNGKVYEVLPIKPIIHSCENNGDIITVNGLFFKNILSNYTFGFDGQLTMNRSNIISFNSTTLVLNSTGYVDNNFFISLFENKSDSYPILKPQQQMVLSSWYDYSFRKERLNIDCTNCLGAKTIGIQNIYTKYAHSIKIPPEDINFSGIYLEAPIYPFKRSNLLPLPTNIIGVNDNKIFQFNGISIVSIAGYFIPKMYDNQAYITGKLEFSNGTLCILDYYTLDSNVLTQGKFNIPSGYGNGNFSIYTKDKLVHSNSFTYQPPSKWISSITQNLEKVQLHLSFPFSFFPITSIKYNDKNGKDLDYTLIEPNIISFTLNTYSTNVLSFNDDYHNETLTNGLNYRPIIYSYSIQNGIITMEGFFISNLSTYKFYLDNSKNAVSSDQITYFDSSRISLIMNQALYVYVYCDDYSFTMVPDLTITSQQDQLLFTCSNCLGGSININEPQSNQDSQFSQIGTIVKQFNTNTIVNKYNIYTFTKDSKTIIIQPPLPTNLIFGASLPKFSTFSNNTIIISSDFLLDKYNGFDYTDFQLQFDNGTIYPVKKQLLSKSAQNYKYQINAPFAFGSGNFCTFITFENNRKLINSIPFYYPARPIINSISKIKIGGFKISGDGFFNVSLIASFKKNLVNTTTGVIKNVIRCDPQTTQSQNLDCEFINTIHTDKLNEFPITILIKSQSNSLFRFEPFYIQSYFYYPNSYSYYEMNNDISLHSVFSKLVATIFIIISILLQ
ncbi:hypothetical protein DDB_G0283243 [Dictyostelium discoideum AX4]|uniref:MRH domain-containing protein n=1 Tax=Dictyostelium discoideum TaxID=44689 RepID=Q54RF7_DICDI|nr:hypothetical protein DDB_G0283243 [Dictyostelium discoideum AX4]EAL65860.1 hypothetical protein DDB_G0283243 [Dictyostelium discoideum AX4]|eukprot:XP_639188.1 hypothetical protein DDB_G0283243 [Dictyostelium discoideum AX4]